MPRHSLSIEERNAYERYAIGRGKAVGFEKRGSMLLGYVDGFMAALTLTPVERRSALDGLERKKRKVKQLSLDQAAPAPDGPPVYVIKEKTKNAD